MIFRFEEFKDRIIFMLMHSDIDWGQRGTNDIWKANFPDVAAYVAKFPEGHWSFFGPGTVEKMVRNSHPQTKGFVERCG